jgi:nicotinamide riboside transporter PnuC
MDKIALIFSLAGIVLNAKKIWLCWLCWLVSNALWLLYFIPKEEWSMVILWGLYSVFNVYGLYQWTRSDDNDTV